MFKNLEKTIDWSKIDKQDHMSAMSKSPTDVAYIHNLLKDALTEDVNNRELFMKGVDTSYDYEEEV